MVFDNCNLQTGSSAKCVTYVRTLGTPEISGVGGCLAKAQDFCTGRGKVNQKKVDYDVIETPFITKG